MIGLRARAKLTWYLEITGQREDGLHDLRSEMLSIDLADVLVLDESADYVRVMNPFEVSVPQDGANIVARALKLVERTAGVTIEKGIPVGGGLGGGSADAAAILRWAGGVSAERALTLGGDVPFCQLGGRALVEGAGERLSVLPFEERRLTLILPGFGVDTADCYRAYDELRAGGWTPSGRNHLEVPACAVEPRLRTTIEWLRAELGPEVQLAGSGSTLFVEGLVEGRGTGEPRHWDVQGPEGTLRFVQTITTPAEA